jgi:phage tail sheath protein FI
VKLCVAKRAMLLVDPSASWDESPDTAVEQAAAGRDALGIAGLDARNAALYFPRIRKVDPLSGSLDTFVPSGAVAGIYAATDARAGVWSAPAGMDAALAGGTSLAVKLTDADNGVLNPLGINCLRVFPGIGSPVVWGARTMRGEDILVDDYQYVPVRRLALSIEESLVRGTQWAVFQPNDETLWSQLRLTVGNFMDDLYRRGALLGSTASEAYFVNCDSTTTTQADIDAGVVNIVVGFAAVRPAEFMILNIQQLAAAAAP